MNILFLDDDPQRRATFLSQVPSATCVSTASECIKDLYLHGPWDQVWLDHDLGLLENIAPGTAETGSDVTRWIAENKPEIGLIILHSLNPAGRAYMRDTLRAVGYPAMEWPFGWLVVNEVR
jgi:hypothetical protein